MLCAYMAATESQASNKGSRSSRLQAQDKINFRNAACNHLIDLLTVNGWPADTEAKDTRISEALTQVNVEATRNNLPFTEMTKYIQDSVGSSSDIYLLLFLAASSH